MALRNPQTITDVNVYLQGKGFLGVVKELSLPVLEKDIRNQENAGLTRPVDLGSFKELKIDFTLQQMPFEVAAWMAASLVIDTPILFKASVLEDKTPKPFLATAKGKISKYELPKFGPKKDVEAKVELALTFWSMIFDSKQAMLFDTENAIAIIDGVDQLAAVRSQLL